MPVFRHLTPLGKLVATIILLVLITLGALLWQSDVPSGEMQGTGIANPASVYCEEQGGSLEIRDEESGQVGYCHLPGGEVCEEWAYFRGECSASGATQALECHESEEYFVVVREGAEFGEDILAKPKSDATGACAYTKEEGDIELPAEEATYFLALEGHFVLLDRGTAPPPRGLEVYDLAARKSVYSDSYNRPFEVASGEVHYWQPIAGEPNAANCPDLALWTSQGLGAGLEREIVLNLATLKVAATGEERCSARQ